MQSLSELKEKLEPHLHTQIDGWYQEFIQKTGKKDIHLFMAYVKQKGLLPSEDLDHIRTETPVDVTEMQTLIASFEEVVTSATSTITLQDGDHDIGNSATLDAPSFKEDEFFDDETIIHTEPQATEAGPINVPSHVNLPEVKQLQGSEKSGPGNAETIELSSVDDDHNIIESIGKGAMGVVYLARDRLLGRKVAFKQVRPDRKDDSEATSRFLREAQITAQLDHPSVPPVYRLVKGYEDLPAYTMKIIEGETLEDVNQYVKSCFQRGETPPKSHSLGTRLEQFLKVCDAISYAHNKGVLHRDLKPKNVMLGRYGIVYVVDWGLARLMYESAEDEEDAINLKNPHGFQSIRTEAGQMMGTPQYMSPEQAQGRVDDMDGRSDLYSLGIILFELVFLKPAIDGSTLLQLVQRILQGDLNPMEHISPKEFVDQRLKEIIAKATALQLANRYQSVEEFADDIRLYMRSATTLKHPSSSQHNHPQKISTERSYLSAILALLLVCSLGFIGWSTYKQKETIPTYKLEQTQRLHQASQLAHQLQQRFAHFERLVHGIGSAARVSLQRKAVVQQPEYHHHLNFQPPDLTKSAFYHDRVSLSWPVIKLPSIAKPGKKRRRRKRRKETSTIPALFVQQFHQLTALRQHLKEALFSSLPETLHRLSSTEKRKLLLRTGFTFASTFVATRDGAMILYPGRKGYPPEYDPRKNDWFQSAKSHKGILWRYPHVSEQLDRGVQVTCLLPFFNHKSTFLGVVGADISLNALLREMEVKLSSYPWIKKAYLVDKKARIILQTGTKFPRYQGKRSAFKTKLKAFPFPGLQLKPSHSGVVVVPTSKSNSQILTYHALQGIPWYFVTQSDTPKPSK